MAIYQHFNRLLYVTFFSGFFGGVCCTILAYYIYKIFIKRKDIDTI